MYADTHTHFYDEWLLPDADAAVQRALDAGVGIMLQADIDSTERPAMWEVGRRYPGVLYQMLGLYPGSVNPETWKDELDLVYQIASAEVQLFSSANNWADAPGKSCTSASPNSVPSSLSSSVSVPSSFPGPLVAIGEIGLDYHENRDNAELQKEVFRLQLELAAKMDLPVNIHLRDAWDDFFEVIEDCRHLNIRGNLHCFSGSYEVYERANRSGEWALGIGGVITFKNSKLAETVARVPMHHILLETDAPYLAPVPHRGQRNESAYIPLIAAKVAEVKGLTLQETEEITTNNAISWFRIPTPRF